MGSVISNPQIKIGNGTYSSGATSIPRGNITVVMNYEDTWSGMRYDTVNTSGYLMRNGQRVATLFTDAYDSQGDYIYPASLRYSAHNQLGAFNVSSYGVFDTLRIVQTNTDAAGEYNDDGWWEYGFAYGVPATPSGVKLSSNYAKAGEEVTLSWNAASANNNVVSQYEVYEGSAKVATVEGTSVKVKTSATTGGSRAFKVRAVGGYGGLNSGFSSEVTLYTYGNPSAPTWVSVDNSMPALGGEVTLSWGGAQDGSYNKIQSYNVYRSTTPDGGYSLLKSGLKGTSLTVKAPESNGVKYYYKAAAVGARSSSGMSSAYATLGANSPPGKPTLQANGTTYNARPRVLITVGADVDGDLQALSAAGFNLSRSSELAPGDHVLAQKASAAPAGDVTCAVTQTDPAGTSSSQSVTVTYTTPTWTDPQMVSGETRVKAAHINEIRDRLDALCTYYGIAKTAWAEDVVAKQTSLNGWRSHILEIQATMTRIARVVNGWDSSGSAGRVTLPTFIEPTTPATAVIEQLRDVITIL